MHIRIILLVFAAACNLLSGVHSASAGATQKTATATTSKPSGFASRSIEANSDEEIDDFETQAQTHLAYRQQQQHQQQQQQQQRPLYDYSQSEEDQEEAPRQLYTNRNIKQQNNFIRPNKKQSSEEIEEEEEEIEEPDRLSTLLAKSSFNCNSKNSGYYADESLNCEVFHYCQENQKHSWICPEGFTFHQIHLICMPPSHDNICQQSSKYHIVNDYLYKPVNLQEHQSRPNVTLRYSERYYPENYYEHERYDDEEEEEPAPRQRVQQHQPQRQSVQVAYHPQQVQQPQQQHIQQQQHTPQQQVQYQQPRPQPVTQIRHQPQTVQQQPTTLAYRKPIPVTTVQPQLHQLQPQIQHQLQTLAPTVTPTPYRFYTPQQHLSQQQVYRTPEEINISLQQRRPQVFIATSTPRYYEDEYLYERRK